jgi:hypothetical protein
MIMMVILIRIRRAVRIMIIISGIFETLQNPGGN